ncbi:ArnT family glycosyltransferase [Komagataeibacter oboediens]|uniref:ArnT family glycosyltransferase n=1 Tax=Komagataeibacter oboediens TaxID=65958 RepID=UPI0030B88254
MNNKNHTENMNRVVEKTRNKNSIWIFLGVFFVCFLLAPHVAFITAHVSLSSNEGWNAYLAQRAIGLDHAPLYPPSDQMVFNNYPPSSFYVVGLFGWLVGDMIVAGRIISLLALLYCAWATGRIVLACGGTRAGAWLAGLLVMIYSAVFYSDYVAMDDPQWLGQAVIMTGFMVLLGNGREPGRSGAWRPFCAGFIMVAGLTFKHNILALPVAVLVWLLLTDRRHAVAWMGGCLLSLCLLGGLYYASFGPDFVQGVLGHKRIFRAYGLLKGLGNVLGLSGMVVSCAFVPWLRLRHRYGLLLGLYLGLAAASAIVQRTGMGVSHNACFEALIAASLCAGLAMSSLATGVRMTGRVPARAVLVGMVGLNLLPVMVSMPAYVPYLYRVSVTSIAEHIDASNETVAAVRAIDGNVACETLALCYWAHKPVVMDFFNYSQHVAVTHDATALERVVDRHDIAAFVSNSLFDTQEDVWEFTDLWRIIRARYTHARLQGVAYIVTP